MAALRTNGASALWVALLTAASMATTLALGCATPFPALAALAAVHMRRRDGLVLMLLAWAARQAIGFALLGYPRDGSTLAWGVGLGTAAAGSALAAHAALRALNYRSVAARLATAYAAGFTAFKAVILGWALILG
ncbi:MAG TPA: hypothetical protein VEZ59_12530, partial [Sphingopyxis sp.]|nr:hypothetical protein [Sphingopyxis sp.]